MLYLAGAGHASYAMVLQRASMLPETAFATIAAGQVHVEPDFLSPRLIRAMRKDAQGLFQEGMFAPDGLTNTAAGLKKEQQGFSKADRQTFRNDAWDGKSGDRLARLEFAEQMRDLRMDLARGLDRPTLAPEGVRKHEMTYNWYEPGAALGRHLDEHHEETKGSKGWLRPTRRSVTWLVYLNEAWDGAAEGGALRTFPRETPSEAPVGADAGNLQVGWLDAVKPVFLDSSGVAGAVLYTVESGARRARRRPLSRPFEVPPKPIDFSGFLASGERVRFEQISTARLDPRFAGADTAPPPPTQGAPPSGQYQDVAPVAGTLVVFDSVTLPHQVQPITGTRQRIAATGWFHEDSQFCLAV